MSSLATNTLAGAILVIDAHAKKYASTRKEVATLVDDYNTELLELQKKHLPAIRKTAGLAAVQQATLHAEIKANPELFVRPRTMTLHGIRLGYAKGKGRIVFADADQLVERIRSQFPEAAARALLDVKTTPIRAAIAQLPADRLKKLGVTIEDVDDAVYIKAVDSEVDKLVAALLGEGSKQEDPS